MKHTPSLTISSVTGHQTYAQTSVYAIETSYHELKTKIPDLRCLLVSPERPAYLPDYILHVPCRPFSYFEYNLFMIYGLGQLIETDFCLIVQNDGWVMNGNNWRDEFFNYDYIGAPYPEFMIIENDRYIGRQSDIHYWLQHADNPPTHHYEHQNGGFCLRSRRLLNAPREYGLTVELAPFDKFDTLPVAVKWTHQLHNIGHVEDVYFSAVKRPFFERLGMKFAPRRLASYFSVDHLAVHLREQIPLTDVLGCHFSSFCTLNGIKHVRLNQNAFRNEDELRANPLMNALLVSGHQLHIPAEFQFNMSSV